MKGALNSLLEAIYPTRCTICGAGGGDIICSSCKAALPLITSPSCSRCGKPTGTKVTSCLDCRDRFKFERARSLGSFEGGLKEAVYALKYKNARTIARELAVLAAPLIEDFNAIDTITFVPLSNKKRSERGYNQAELIAKELSSPTGLPFTNTLRRTKEEFDQVGLTPAERRRNVKGVFEVSFIEAIEGKNLLLVDDVFTTGATADECIRSLLKAKAKKVDLLTMARVVKG